MLPFARCVVACVLAGFWVIPARAAALPLTYSTEASAGWSENISHTSAAANRKSAARYQAAGSAGMLHEWAGGLVTMSSLEGAIDTAPRYPKFGSFTVGPQMTVRRKFGLGAFAPVLEAGGELAYRATRVGLDDGWTTTANLRLSKRLTSSWRVAVTGDWSRHDGRTATFTTDQHRLFGQLAWDPTDWLQISYGAGRLWGTVIANAAGDVWARALSGGLGNAVLTYYNTVPWRRTDIFGPGWVSYRVEGYANFQWLELSPALGRNTSLPLRLERTNTTNLIGIKYPQEFWSLSLLHRF
jgi:hypothetical protein